LQLAFQSTGLRDELLQAISDLGFTTPTPIQEKAIPFLLGKDNDLVALAQTGTGKTAAFGLPLLERMDPADKRTQALILCPTRELCLQITNDLLSFGKYLPAFRVTAIYGGASMDGQAFFLSKGAQIVVGTPGRTLDMIRRGDLRIGELKWLVLDEADEMLNRGFKRDLDAILGATPRGKRTLLFSATMPPEIAKIAQEYLKLPERISVGTPNSGATTVSHTYLLVQPKGRYEAVCKLLDKLPDFYGIVFCRTKRKTREVAIRLKRDGYLAEGLEGDMAQRDRDRAMAKFRAGAAKILVATDVAARGVDVTALSHVVHFNLPDDDAAYVHRCGRTGRAGLEGISIALVEQSEMSQLPVLEKLAKKPIKPYATGSPNTVVRAPQREERPSKEVPIKQVQRPTQASPTKSAPAALDNSVKDKQPKTLLPQAQPQYRKLIQQMHEAQPGQDLELQLSSLMPLVEDLDRHEIVAKFLALLSKGGH
jgi:ATP-dependent RNA helicase DeaD